MPRCPDCTKFVGYGDMNTDEVEFELDEESGVVAVTGRIVLPCGECGTDLKALDVDDQVDMTEHFGDPEDYLPKDTPPEKADGLLEVSFAWIDEPAAEGTERSENKDRKGRAIKNPRYMRTFRGVEASGRVARTVRVKTGATGDGGEPVWEEHTDEADFSFEKEEQASAFEDCT